MKNVLLKIEYDGSEFSGWARQPGHRTVQGELERILSELCRCNISVEGTGRTDSGVHAIGQMASFSGDFNIPVNNLAKAANDMLAYSRFKGGDVRIVNACEVPEDFHARFDAKGKTYTYMIRNSVQMPVFLRNYRYNVKKELNFNAMKAAIAHFKGKHDFASFMAAGGTPQSSTIRTVYGVQIAAFDCMHAAPLTRVASGAFEGQPACGGKSDTPFCDIAVSVTGDGFLYNMVRIMVGTLVDVGLGRIAPEAIPGIMAGCDRQLAGHTAPPQGLYMQQVYFDEAELLEGAKRTPKILPRWS